MADLMRIPHSGTGPSQRAGARLADSVCCADGLDFCSLWIGLRSGLYERLGWLRWSLAVKLHEHHLLIRLAVSQQFVVRAVVDKPAALQQHDVISVHDRAEAMRDYKGGAAFHERGETRLNEPFALGVEIAGRFVKDQDAGIGEHRPGDVGIGQFLKVPLPI